MTPEVCDRLCGNDLRRFERDIDLLLYIVGPAAGDDKELSLRVFKLSPMLRYQQGMTSPVLRL